jgi:hypothetical protein
MAQQKGDDLMMDDQTKSIIRKVMEGEEPKIDITNEMNDLLTFVQETAFEYTFEETGVHTDGLGDWHDAQIKQARALCDAFGLNWEARDFSSHRV